jgi:hypothetical protein
MPKVHVLSSKEALDVQQLQRGAAIPFGTPYAPGWHRQRTTAAGRLI